MTTITTTNTVITTEQAQSAFEFIASRISAPSGWGPSGDLKVMDRDFFELVDAAKTVFSFLIANSCVSNLALESLDEAFLKIVNTDGAKADECLRIKRLIEGKADSKVEDSIRFAHDLYAFKIAKTIKHM